MDSSFLLKDIFVKVRLWNKCTLIVAFFQLFRLQFVSAIPASHKNHQTASLYLFVFGILIIYSKVTSQSLFPRGLSHLGQLLDKSVTPHMISPPSRLQQTCFHTTPQSQIPCRPASWTFLYPIPAKDKDFPRTILIFILVTRRSLPGHCFEPCASVLFFVPWGSDPP